MKTTQLIRFASLVTLASASLVACGDNQGDPNGGGAGSSMPAAMPFPASCADVAQGEPLPDGPQMLYVDNDPAKMWQAFCHDTNEYLTLPSTNADANFGIYQAGGDALGQSVKTQYARVRIDPATLTIDIADRTFATSTGDITHSGDPDATTMPFGVAMACGGDLVIAKSEIDLSGTPFDVALTEFAPNGVNPYGEATLRDPQVMQLTTDGSCGWEGPSSMAAGEPINLAGPAYVLHLTYGTH
jgi:hypothetical protein